MLEQDLSKVEMRIIQNGLGDAIKVQREAHEALVFASRETQKWRKRLAIFEQQISANPVVHRQ